MAMTEIKLSDSKLLKSFLKSVYHDLSEDELSLEKGYCSYMRNNKAVFASHLKKIRKIRGLNQAELCKRLQVTQASYSAWETEKYVPKIEFVKRLSEILEVDATEFICKDIKILNGEKDVPVVTEYFFSSLDFDRFCKNLADYFLNTSSITKAFPISKEIDFCFYVQNYDMAIPRGGIPNESLLVCNSKILQNTTNIERLKYVNNHVAVLSINKQPAIVREVHFDGEHLTLIKWNKTQDQFSLKGHHEQNIDTAPLKPSVLLKTSIKSEDEVDVKDVEVFALVTEAVVDLL